MGEARVWYSAPEIRAAYRNGRDFTGLDLKNIVFTSESEDDLLDLTGANFRDCNLSFAEFHYCNVKGAEFGGADLKGCGFYNCHFGSSPVLNGVEMCADILEERYVNLAESLMPLFSIDNILVELDTTGQELIGYKALAVTRPSDEKRKLVIAKLLIPTDAKRVVFNDGKCRCEKARVMAIYSIDKKLSYGCAYAFIYNRHGLVYKVGEEVCPDKFDDCAKRVCSNGIHFFLTEEEAINYGKHYM